jgi:hypothetical protein
MPSAYLGLQQRYASINLSLRSESAFEELWLELSVLLTGETLGNAMKVNERAVLELPSSCHYRLRITGRLILVLLRGAKAAWRRDSRIDEAAYASGDVIHEPWVRLHTLGQANIDDPLEAGITMPLPKQQETEFFILFFDPSLGIKDSFCRLWD